MLPSFRLIAATFLCGFIVVFAGLRLAASLNDIHEGLPVMAAHAAPVSIAPLADGDMRRGQLAVPVMYDLRFAVSPISPTLVNIAPLAPEHPAPPLSLLPPENIARDLSAAAEAEPAQPDGTVAAIQPDAAIAADPQAAPAPDTSDTDRQP